jgi:hypothetical protein
MRDALDFFQEPDLIAVSAPRFVLAKRLQFRLHHGTALPPHDGVYCAKVSFHFFRAPHVGLHGGLPYHAPTHVGVLGGFVKVIGHRKGHGRKGFAYGRYVLWVIEGFVDVLLKHTHCLQKLLFTGALAVALKNIAFHAIGVSENRLRH